MPATARKIDSEMKICVIPAIMSNLSLATNRLSDVNFEIKNTPKQSVANYLT